jgi:hypothetical protein
LKDNKIILNSLKIMFQTFNRKPEPEVMAIYVKCLEEYSMKQIMQGIEDAIKTCEYCPVPAILIDIVSMVQRYTDEEIVERDRIITEKFQNKHRLKK